jgi:hypothetical protein
MCLWIGMEQMACFLSGPILCSLCDRWILANPGHFLGNLISYHPQKGEKEASSVHTFLLSWSNQEIIYVLEKCAAMLGQLRKPLGQKILGKFLKLCGNGVQVYFPFSLVLEFSHSKTKMCWFCGARQMQKNVSLWGRQVKNLASAGIRPKRMFRFGTKGCKVTVAEITAQRSWTGIKFSVPAF